MRPFIAVKIDVVGQADLQARNGQIVIYIDILIFGVAPEAVNKDNMDETF